MIEEEVIVLFGASGGIASALAQILSEQGKRVILCGRNREKLEILSHQINQPYFVCDGSSEPQAEETLEKIINTYGRIDGVANCIGSFFIKPFSMTSSTDWREVINANLISCFSILKASIEKIRKGGAIVFVSSCAATIGLAHHEVIAAAKGAVVSLVRSAAASYALKGVRINAVAPGLTDTPLAKSIVTNEGALKSSIAFHPLGRIGTPEDIAQAISWLLSKESSWITGQVLAVDGGLSHIKLRS